MSASAPNPWNAMSLRPRSADSTRTGLTLSLVAHAALLAALSLGVQWRSEKPAVMEAQLWSATPQMAAPPAPPAEEDPAPQAPQQTARPEPPAPSKADLAAAREAEIALERRRKLEKQEEERKAQELQRQREDKLRKEQAEKEKAHKEKLAREAEEKLKRDKELEKERAQEREKAAKAEKDKADKAAKADAARQAAAEEARLKKLRDDQMRRLNAQLGGMPGGTATATPGNGPVGSTGTAAQSSGPAGDADYAGRIVARIKPNVVLTDSVSGNPEAVVEVRLAPDGKIIGRRLLKPSGQSAWDEAVLKAIDRTDMLPRRPDGTVPGSIAIHFRPRD